MDDRSTFLFATPTFIEGWGRLIDFGNFLTEFNTTLDPDARALSNDWRVVGTDMDRALKAFSRELEHSD